MEKGGLGFDEKKRERNLDDLGEELQRERRVGGGRRLRRIALAPIAVVGGGGFDTGEW